MPQSDVIVLTDPAGELPLHRDSVTIQPIQGEYSRDKLMLQRIRSYIVRYQCCWTLMHTVIELPFYLNIDT